MKKYEHRNFKLSARRQKELRMFRRKVGAFYNGWNHANLKRRIKGLPYHRRKNIRVAVKRLQKSNYDTWYNIIMKGCEVND